MLKKVSDEIANCYRRAAECREKADAATNVDTKRDYSALEHSWLFLARSYELSERLSDFTNETNCKKNK
jgi:hypothetical protein